MHEELKQATALFLRVAEALPQIRYAGDPCLRTLTDKVKDVAEAAPIIQQLSDTLLAYRKITGVGRGMAAPQLGVLKAVFVTYVNDKLEAFINPEILEASSTTNFYREVCISSGIMAVDVERPEWIAMRWMDASGAIRNGRFDGILARLYQHEADHLRGVLNLDIATPMGIAMAISNPTKETLRTVR